MNNSPDGSKHDRAGYGGEYEKQADREHAKGSQTFKLFQLFAFRAHNFNSNLPTVFTGFPKMASPLVLRRKTQGRA